MRNKIQLGVEVLIALYMVVGGVSLFFAEAVVSSSYILALLGTAVAGYLYGSIFIAEALVLICSRIFHKPRLHQNALLAIYLTSIFATIIEWSLLGLSFYLIDQSVVGLLAAAFWLRYKLDREYMEQCDLFTDEEIHEIWSDR